MVSGNYTKNFEIYEKILDIIEENANTSLRKSYFKKTLISTNACNFVE